MKLLTFSRYFPAYHPKAGQPTHFVEKIHASLGIVEDNKSDFEEHIRALNVKLFNEKQRLIIDFTDVIDWENDFEPKHHTIRSGHRFKAGDWFSPRVWSGQPYRSKQIIIAPPIQVKKVWDIEFNARGFKECLINGKIFAQLNYGYWKDKNKIGFERLAYNDGLDLEDLIAWLYKDITTDPETSFKGQIICWNDKIEY